MISQVTPLETLSPEEEMAARYPHMVVPHYFERHFPEEQHKANPSNRRKSTRYTWWNFLPVAFGLQFTKVVNIFYCVTAILQCIPQIQTNSPLAVLVPLMFVISLGILKELIAELKRYKEDKEVNATPVIRMGRDGQLETTCLAQVQVGDIIKVEDKEQVPADCVLLATKSETHECFVKTAALDGERNLKPKLAVKQVSGNFDALLKNSAGASLPFHVKSKAAEKDMYSYEGKLFCHDGTLEQGYQLDLNQFLHRGCYVENSGHCFGLVVHTGSESKLIMNLGQYRFKKSRFEMVLNYVLVANLLLAIVFSIFAAICNSVWTAEHLTHQYIF